MQQRMFNPWGGFHQRPRLLIEDPNPALEVSEFRFFEVAGFDVALCSGPCGGESCPLVGGGGCQLVDCADLVLMGPGMADHRDEVAAAIQRRRPDLPVIVQVPRTDPGECPAGCIPSAYPISVEGQLRALWQALDRRPAAAMVPAGVKGAARPPGVPGPGADRPRPSTVKSPTLARLVDLLGW